MPQLCGKIEFSDSSLSNLIAGKSVVLQEKLDGERVMMHWVNGELKVRAARAARRGEFVTSIAQLYSRLAGRSQPESYAAVLRPYAEKCINATTCILDGELVAYDDDVQSMVKFGQNQGVALEEHRDPASRQHMWFVPFDVLWVDGCPKLPGVKGSVIGEPLGRRLEARECARLRRSACGNAVSQYLEAVISPVDFHFSPIKSTFVREDDGSVEQRRKVLFDRCAAQWGPTASSRIGRACRAKVSERVGQLSGGDCGQGPAGAVFTRGSRAGVDQAEDVRSR